jgi:hypothetical protein
MATRRNNEGNEIDGETILRPKRSHSNKMDFTSQLRATCIAVAVNELIRREDSNGGRLPHLAMEEIIDGLRKQGIVVDRNHLNYKKRVARNSNKPVVNVVIANNSGVDTEVSDVTGTSTTGGGGTQRRGRPSGTTNEAKSKRWERRADCINDITQCYAAALELLKDSSSTTNRKAIADRGWFPPNRNLLLHPEIEHDEDENNDADDENENDVTVSTSTNENNTLTTTSNLQEGSLNFNDGKAGSCLEKILQYRSRHGGIEKQRKNLDQGKSIIEEMAKGRRLTSGLLVSRGEHSLNNQSVLNCLRARNGTARENFLRCRPSTYQARHDQMVGQRLHDIRPI